MRLSKLSEYAGKVVVLELANGKEVTTKIVAIHEDGGVTCSKPLMFMPVPDPANPNNLNIIALPYGHPVSPVEGDIEFDNNHIVAAFEPALEHRNAYTQKTSGIMPASAGALDGLPPLDLGGLGR